MRKKLLPYRTHVLILFLLVSVAYFGVADNGFLADDVGGVIGNPHIGDLRFVFTHPFTFVQPLIYFILYSVGGRNPVVFHLFNVCVHMVNTLLIYFIIFRMDKRKKIAFFTAALFAVHPILTESVTWISGGPYTVYTMFLLAAFLAYLHSFKNKLLYLFSILFFLLGLEVSEKAVAFPFILTLYYLLFERTHKSWRYILPYWVITFIGVGIYLTQIGDRFAAFKRQFASGTSWRNPTFYLPMAITSYIQLILVPRVLTLYHSERVGDIEYWVRVMAFIGFVGMIVWTLIKKQRLLFFWLMFFVLSLLPTITPLRIASITAERYVYLGSVGIIYTLVWGIEWLSRKIKVKWLDYIVISVIVVLFIMRTISRNADWKDEVSFWTSTSVSSPYSFQAHANLGRLYLDKGEMTKAADEFEKTVALKPDFAEVHYNLGYIYRQLGMADKSLEHYGLAVKYQPAMGKAYQNMSAIYFMIKDYAMAEKSALFAIKYAEKENPILYLNLGYIYMGENKKDEAISTFKKLLRIDPTNEGVKQTLKTLE
ncbi:MAG: tetratricopeptide repeat protein [bacterium]|nr:tetratricopeptide repeat protein [bacterium]